MLYEKIQEICDSKGITVSGLEKDLGFSNSTIRKWKNSSPSIENLKKVADYFGITVDELISGEKERRTVPVNSSSEQGVRKCLRQ